MNRRDLQNIFDMVLDMGESPLHRIGFTHNDISTAVNIFLKTENDKIGNICSTLRFYEGDELTAKDVEWLTNWKAVFERERVECS